LKLNSFIYEKKFSSLEKKEANEMEMAAQKNEKGEKIEKTAQGWIKIKITLRIQKSKNIFLNPFYLSNTYWRINTLLD